MAEHVAVEWTIVANFKELSFKFQKLGIVRNCSSSTVRLFRIIFTQYCRHCGRWFTFVRET